MSVDGSLLKRLYAKHKTGKGTDLEVACPKVLGEPALQSFHLHGCIAAEASDYFGNIFIPRNGRVIQEVDAATFQLCVDFMYLQDQDAGVNHDNVASVLAAAAFLCMKDLTRACFDYLDRHLDNDNHETVKELAEQFDNPVLAEKSNRFATPNNTRCELYKRKAEAERKVTEASRLSSTTREQERKHREELGGLERQLRFFLAKHLSIHDFAKDKAKDYFIRLLFHSQDHVLLGHVIIRSLQKRQPTATPDDLAHAAFPCGFKSWMMWKSSAAFRQTMKNLKAKLKTNNKRLIDGKTYAERLEERVNLFQLNGRERFDYNHEGGTIEQAVDALFRGFSEEGVSCLKQWRLDYLVWRRSYYEAAHGSYDHATAAFNARGEMFTNPQSKWR
jgi:hypothetical protein